MPDELLNPTLAAYLWLYTQGFNPEQNWQPGSNTCNSVGVNWTPLIFFNNLQGGSIVGELVGVDTDRAVAYFHLTHLQCVWNESRLAMHCTIWFDQVPPFAAHSESSVEWQGITSFQLDINDNAGAVAPYDGHVVIPCPGYPVVAAVQVSGTAGNGTWKAFAAGTAGALDVASAAAATQTADTNLNAGAPDPIDIQVWFDEPH